MAFISTVSPDEAQGTLRDLYQANLDALGYVANYTRAFSLRPEVFEAWQALIKAIATNMELRHYELATLAAATALRSSYCSLAHGKILRTFFGDPEIIELAAGSSAPLTPAETALMDFARRVALQADRVTQDEIDTLRAHGFSDAAILDIALAAAARCFFSKTLDAVGAQPDRIYGELEPALREALTVGRSIAQG